MAERLLTMREARTRAAMGASKWRELCRVGALPILRLNSRFYRVREADLDEWIADGCPVPDDVAVTAKALALREKRAAAKAAAKSAAAAARSKSRARGRKAS